MSSKPLSTRSLLDLIGLFERSNQSITDAEGQRLRGVPGWEIFHRTSLSARELAEWTACVGYAGCFPAPCGDERVPVELHEDSDPTRYRYRCPETFRRKSVAATEVAVYAVHVPMLLHVVADLLDVPQALRRGIESPAIDGVLWKLGTKRIGQMPADVWLVRGLQNGLEDVHRHFQAQMLPDRGLILSTGATLSHLLRPIRDYRVIAFRDILIEGAQFPAIHEGLLHRVLGIAPDETPAAKHPVQFDEAEGRLTIATRNIPPWTITGKTQAAVVSYLVEQLHRGRCLIPAKEVLDKVYGRASVGHSKRVSEIFKGNTYWQDYIVQDGEGQYGVKLQ